MREFRLADGTVGHEAGRGAPVVLLHGVGLDRHMWRGQIDALSGRFRIIAYDLAGHGESAKLNGEPLLSLWTKQLDDVADALALRELALVGFSFGGMIAKAYAAQSNRVSRLAIMSAVHQRSEAEQAGVDGRLVAARRDGPHAIVEAALTRWFSEAFAAANPDAIMSVKQRLLGNDPASFLAAYAAFARGDANDLSRIRCPALVMTGELDAGSTPQMARWMADAIAGAELCIVPGARHMMPVEHEAEIANILRRFLGWRKS